MIGNLILSFPTTSIADFYLPCCIERDAGKAGGKLRLLTRD